MNDTVRCYCGELADFFRRRIFLRKDTCPVVMVVQQEFRFQEEIKSSL
jgi:hypothetical protein